MHHLYHIIALFCIDTKESVSYAGNEEEISYRITKKLCLYAFAVILYFTVILYRIGSECILQRKIQYMKWQKTLGRGEHQRTEKTESIDSVHLAGMLPVC